MPFFYAIENTHMQTQTQTQTEKERLTSMLTTYVLRQYLHIGNILEELRDVVRSLGSEGSA